ncbi:MAG: type II toxin-antitoxin system VapC family toxin [Candidatus Poribacteria bacterium]
MNDIKIFIDTWGWLTLRDRSEAEHHTVKIFYQEFNKNGGISYTSDYVLDETITLLFRRLPFHQARESLEQIEEAIETGYLILERIKPERFEKAKELRLRYQDKPLISFTDFTSAVVMTEKGIDAILTEDKHFIYLEAGFRTVP